jgi:hypothetical protein
MDPFLSEPLKTTCHILFSGMADGIIKECTFKKAPIPSPLKHSASLMVMVSVEE